MRRGSGAILALAFVIAASCSGSTTSTSGGAAATSAAGSSGGTAGGTPVAGGPSFGQVLTASKSGEYKVTYKLTATGGASSTGEQSWYFKPPRARFDFVSSASGQQSTVSLFALPDGAFLCFGTGATAQCIGMSGLETALQQNPAAMYQEALIQHPDQWNGVLVETRQIAGQQANCYDVRPVSAVAAGLSEGRFCYSTSGIPLLQRFAAQGGTWSLEATSISMSVPDSDFKLPATPTTIGRP